LELNETNDGHISLHIKCKIKCCLWRRYVQRKYKYGTTSLDPPLEHINTDYKHGYEDVRSDVVMTGNIKTNVFWDGMLHNLIEWYQSF